MPWRNLTFWDLTHRCARSTLTYASSAQKSSLHFWPFQPSFFTQLYFPCFVKHALLGLSPSFSFLPSFLSHIFDPCLYSWSRSFLVDPLFILLGTESFVFSLEIARLIFVALLFLPLLHLSGSFDDLRAIRSSPLLFLSFPSFSFLPLEDLANFLLLGPLSSFSFPQPFLRHLTSHLLVLKSLASSFPIPMKGLVLAFPSLSRNFSTSLR